jgi:hypothetical protein
VELNHDNIVNYENTNITVSSKMRLIIGNEFFGKNNNPIQIKSKKQN